MSQSQGQATRRKSPPAGPPDPRPLEAVLDLEEGPAPARWGRVLAAALACLLVAVAGYASLGRRDSNATAGWVFAEVTRGDLTVTVTATGTVEPTHEVEISSELSGTVRTVHVDFNDRVAAGQVLAVLDTDKLEAQTAVSRATLASKRARVLEAKATGTEKRHELARARRLVESGARSVQELETAQAAHERALAALASAEAEVQVAEADLRLKETDLSKAKIRSPIEGVVLQRNVDPGQTVAASLQAPVLFTLAEDLSRMELQVDVDEADVGVTRVGQAALFTVDAYPDQRFPAVLRQLRISPETSEGVVTYKAILSIDNSSLLLRPGMTATAEVTVKEVEEALLVPNEALRFEPPSAAAKRSLLDSLVPWRRFHLPSERAPRAPHVWVLRDGAPFAVDVGLGPTDGDRTVALSADLQPGQQLLVDVRERR